MGMCGKKQNEAQITKQEAVYQNFHQSMSMTLILGQIFGIMPIHGVSESSEKQLYFKWSSWKILYSSIIVLSITFPLFMTFHHMIFYDASVTMITTIIFFGSGLLTQIQFIFLASKWTSLMKAWSLMEISMRSYRNPPRLKMRLRVMTIVIFTVAAIEHFLVTLHNYLLANDCKFRKTNLVEFVFVEISFPQVFRHIRYNFWMGVFLQMLNIICTFSWTYIDLFIMLVSTSLSLRFGQITEKVEMFLESRISNENMWRSLREDYNRLGKLCHKLNEAIAYIVILSFGSNLFFIIIQFFNSLRKMKYALEKVYFFYSFLFLICRTICVCLYGAWIHDESQKPLEYLNAVPSFMYNIEIRRFILHVCFDSACLTGKRFFNVTRRIILSIAGTIVAYELVLIQFYGSILNNADNKNTTIC